jgi:CYTH domain-containing protein
MVEIEYELTYLAKQIPSEVQGVTPSRVIDYYLPEAGVEHPHMRIRAKGDTYELTKKQPIEGKDSSAQTEHTISLSPEEYADLSANRTRYVAKDRYKVVIDGHEAEVDVFKDALEGLVLIDFEFSTREEQLAFTMPEVCLADVTQETFIAGGILAGKSYADLQEFLEQYGYIKLNAQ